MQKRDNDTHRLVQVETATVTDRGPHLSRAAKGGAGAKPAGKRLAPEIGHRADTAKEATGLPLLSGGKERVAVVRPIDRREARDEMNSETSRRPDAHATPTPDPHGAPRGQRGATRCNAGAMLVPMLARCWRGDGAVRGYLFALCQTPGYSQCIPTANPMPMLCRIITSVRSASTNSSNITGSSPALSARSPTIFSKRSNASWLIAVLEAKSSVLSAAQSALWCATLAKGIKTSGAHAAANEFGNRATGTTNCFNWEETA